MDSPPIVVFHFLTHWLKVASWRAKSLRNMFFWLLLVETMAAPVHYYIHQLEDKNDFRCAEMALAGAMRQHVFDSLIQEYILTPIFVYGYLLPKFVRHWTRFQLKLVSAGESINGGFFMLHRVSLSIAFRSVRILPALQRKIE